MTVNSSVNTTTVLGTGSQTQFTFPFIGVAAAYISVIFTDANGNETVLQRGSGSSQYQIILNPPVAGAIWGLGGTVTYNPGGTPIAVGTTLTIFRILPLTQAISLQNLISLATLGNGAETGIDTLEMQLQQIAELQGRAIVAPIVDSPTINLTLPAAAQRANTGLAFDSQGNVIAGTTPATGLISSAMQPVVDAASLALGRAAFGLGAMATEGIGAGLQDDGSGNARVFYNVVADAANQTVTAAFHLTQRIASASSLSVPLIYSLPRANTLFNAFGFWVFALSGNATLTPNANDNFDGLASGVSVAVPQGTWAWVTTNAATSGTWHIEYNNKNIALQATATGNTLVITLNAAALPFRDPTLTSGDEIWQNIPAGLTITVPNGATLGTSNGVPSRVWVFVARNNGVPVLGVALGSTSSAIFPIASFELGQNTASAISAAADSAGVLYTASSITNDVVRIVGYVEFATGQATAGTWASSPSKVQPMQAGTPKPGTVLQTVVATLTSQATASTPAFANTGLAAAITPSAAMNPIMVNASGALETGAASGNTASGAIFRGSAPTTQISPVQKVNTVASGNQIVPGSFQAFDLPGVTSQVTYNLGAAATGNPGFFGAITSPAALMIAQELMG